MNSSQEGKDPTLGAVISMEEQLSLDPNHIPSLSCRVIDLGINLGSNLIGTFQIDLGYQLVKTELSIGLKLKAVVEALDQIEANQEYENQDVFEGQ